MAGDKDTTWSSGRAGHWSGSLMGSADAGNHCRGMWSCSLCWFMEWLLSPLCSCRTLLVTWALESSTICFGIWALGNASSHPHSQMEKNLSQKGLLQLFSGIWYSAAEAEMVHDLWDIWVRNDGDAPLRWGRYSAWLETFWKWGELNSYQLLKCHNDEGIIKSWRSWPLSWVNCFLWGQSRTWCFQRVVPRVFIGAKGAKLLICHLDQGWELSDRL